jgi:transglutaminase-like putative cysteine protease
VQNQAELSRPLVCKTARTLRVEYSAPVGACHRSLQVFPPAVRGGQQIIELQWHCAPTPDESHEIESDFGNRVLVLHHKRIARAFQFEMALTTQHEYIPIARESNLPPTGIGAFLLPSALCDLTIEIERRAKDLLASNASPLALATQFCEFAFQQVEYSPGTTHQRTSASQSLHQKKGVCQDHAHLMIAFCRAAKIPARYISGYLPGEGAMHAWVEVLLENNWQGFDPTHNRLARNDYVFTACGRDARDCAPHQGSFRGHAHARLESHCKTQSL